MLTEKVESLGRVACKLRLSVDALGKTWEKLSGLRFFLEEKASHIYVANV